MEEDLIYISNSKRNQKAGHTINNVFSRSGVIERMAKALCMRNHGVFCCDNCLCNKDVSCFGCLEMEKNNASAALDALIKGE